MEKIRKIHWRTGINRIKKSNVWLAVGINLVFLLSILLFCDIKYETSDDFIMASIMSGAFGGEPNPHMIFINIIWGYILLPFYYLNSHISWYLIAQILLCFASCTIFSYMLLEKSDKKPAVMLIVLLLTFFADDVYVLVQFTKTAVLAVMAGGAVFMWALAENKTKKLKIFSALLCLLGTMVRFNTIFLAGGFLTILIISETLIFFKDKHNNWKKRLLGFFLPGFLLIGAAVGIRQIDQAIYNSDEEYKYFREYNAARAAIVDASDYGYEAYREELEKIGISENDYLLLRSWNFADNEVFSLEVMEKAAQIISDYKENVEISKEAILEGMQERQYFNYPGCIAFVILFVLTAAWGNKYFWAGLPAAGMGVLYLIYFFVIERVVYRTEFGIFLCMFLCLCFFWGKNPEGRKGHNVEITRICAIITLVCVIMQSVLYIPDRSYLDVTEESRKDYIEETFFESWNYDARKYRKVVNKNVPANGLIEEIEANRQNFYFLDFQTTMQTLYYEWNPFYTLPEEYFQNSLYFASIMTNYPECIEILSGYHAEQPLKALANENVYLVDSDTRTLQWKITYLQEHYYPDARAELYKEIDGYQIWKVYTE